MSRTIIGIDPGQTGCLCALHIFDDGRKEVAFYDTPLLELRSGKKIKHEYNEALMGATLRQLSVLKGVTCVLEKVSAMPGQGVTSMFNFGMGYGIWRGMLSSFKVPYSLVHPQTWKALVCKDMPKEKDAARLRAMQLYPQVAPDLARKKDIGRADALLLCHYGLLTGVQAAASSGTLELA